MTKEHVIRIREMFKDFPILITSDNQRLYYDGGKETNILIWHDDEELLEIHRTTLEQASDLHPVEVVFIEYDTIQEITLYPNVKAYREYLTSIKGSMTAEKYEYAEKLLTSAVKTLNSRTMHSQGFGYAPKTE